MGLSVGFDSSLRYWLTKTAGEALPEPAGSAAIARATAGLREVRAESLPFGPDERRPLHLLVPDRRLGHRMDGAVAHVISRPLPEGSLCRLSGDNTIASPELTYAQMAASEPFTETVRIGCYLCSTFSIGDDGRDYVGERGQLTTVESLRAYVDRLPPGTRGVRRAREALAYVIDGLASPMEVFLGMGYGMPPNLGGMGPFVMHANQRIEIDEQIQELLGSRFLKGDLYLPEFGTDLEYDSRRFHTGQYRLDHTQARRNAIEAMGIKTVSATYGQIDTFAKFENFTWMLRKRLGLDQPEYSPEERQAQMALYDTLLSPTSRLF